ncbi:MAG: molybdate ABC transporter substrate-binding protein [Blastocatellia bacterium]
MFRLMIFALVFLLIGCNSNQNFKLENQTLTIAAAANLETVLTEIGKDFQTETKIKPIFSFGATGNLAKQIENGAPFDLFLAADVKTIDLLIAKNHVINSSKKVYTRGKLILYYADGITINSLTDLTKPEFKQIAIASPELAPYGLAAKQALQNIGIWSNIEKKIVYAENVNMALQYAKTGNVQAAFVARSLVTDQDKYLLIDENLHSPLDQALAVVTRSKNKELAEKFTLFLATQKSKTLLEKFGYSVVQQ